MDRNTCYTFIILHPENRIVLNHREPSCIHISTFDKVENKEMVDLLNGLTIYAYSSKWTKFNSPSYQKDEILDFQNEIFLSCFDKIDQ